MKKFIIYFSQSVVVLMLMSFFYRLGYCNGCDKYIGASACKPSRQLCFFNTKF